MMQLAGDWTRREDRAARRTAVLTNRVAGFIVTELDGLVYLRGLLVVEVAEQRESVLFLGWTQAGGAWTLARLPASFGGTCPTPVCASPPPIHTMINAVLVFNNAGQPRLTKFYTQLVHYT